MKTVKAHWEKRNINKNCLEITVEEKDINEDVLKKLKPLKADYKVIKIPTNNVSLLFALQKEGFFFYRASYNMFVFWRTSKIK